MGKYWNEIEKEILKLRSDLTRFEVDFLERESFEIFVQYLLKDVQDYHEIGITGWFSERIRKPLKSLIDLGRNVRLICREFPSNGSTRNRKNLEVLKKLVKAGAKIRVNDRAHLRLFIAHNPEMGEGSGLVVIGSFDFNYECIGQERYDAGIKTRHPDLVKSAVDLFEEIWSESMSIPLEEFLKKGKK